MRPYPPGNESDQLLFRKDNRNTLLKNNLDRIGRIGRTSIGAGGERRRPLVALQIDVIGAARAN